MWWDPYGAGWQQWNGGTCTNVAAAQDGSAYITNDCGTVYHSGGRGSRCMRCGLAGCLRGAAHAVTLQHTSHMRWPCDPACCEHHFLADWEPLCACSTSHAQAQAPGRPCTMLAQLSTSRLA